MSFDCLFVLIFLRLSHRVQLLCLLESKGRLLRLHVPQKGKFPEYCFQMWSHNGKKDQIEGWKLSKGQSNSYQTTEESVSLTLPTSATHRIPCSLRKKMGESFWSQAEPQAVRLIGEVFARRSKAYNLYAAMEVKWSSIERRD